MESNEKWGYCLNCFQDKKSSNLFCIGLNFNFKFQINGIQNKIFCYTSSLAGLKLDDKKYF